MSLNNNLWLWSLSVVLIKNCNGSIDIIFAQILCVCVCVCVRETQMGDAVFAPVQHNRNNIRPKADHRVGMPVSAAF